MTMLALLLGHDDQVVAELMLPRWVGVVELALPVVHTWAPCDPLVLPEISTCPFLFDPVESELWQMISRRRLGVWRCPTWGGVS